MELINAQKATTIEGLGGWEKKRRRMQKLEFRGEGRPYRHPKRQPLQFRLICFSTLVQPADE